MSEELDVAISPLRACEPSGTDWTLEQLCKYGWVPKIIRISYKFGFNAAADQYLYDHYEDYEFQGDEISRVCAPESWLEIGEGGSGDRWDGMEFFDGSGVPNTEQFGQGIGRHDDGFPVFFRFLGFSDEYIYDFEGYFFDGMLNRYDSPGADEFPDALEIVTKDNAGADVSFFYPLYGTHNGADFPFMEPEFAGPPYGFIFESGDFIKYEVLEWLSYGGVWDTTTGELLAADPWNP
jgi:hypothetical protein